MPRYSSNNEIEILFRKELRRYHSLATSLQWNLYDEIHYRRFPELQAYELLSGAQYRAAACLYLRVLIGGGEFDDTICPHCGETVSDDEIYKQKLPELERILKEKYDPVSLTREIMMPSTKVLLHAIEATIVELGFRLPKWERPQWLREIEMGLPISGIDEINKKRSFKNEET